MSPAKPKPKTPTADDPAARPSAAKTRAAIDAGLSVIFCCGETLEEREAGKTQAVVEEQLQAVVEAITPEQWK